MSYKISYIQELCPKDPTRISPIAQGSINKVLRPLGFPNPQTLMPGPAFVFL
jgi:hypothetical protein